jgi:hypothetical protein
VVSDDVVRKAHSNLVEAFAMLPRHQPKGLVRLADGVMVAATGSPVTFFNQVLFVTDQVDADAVTGAAEVLDAAGLSWTAHLREGIDDRQADTLVQLGLVEDDSYPAMVLTSSPAPAPVPAGVDIVRVEDESGFEVHVRTAATLSGSDPDIVRTWLDPGIVDEDGVVLFSGYLDGTPVAISMSVLYGDSVGVYNVNVAVSARRRGIGWAMTHAALTAGVDAGASLVVLQSSPMAESMYGAGGFEYAFRYRLFHRPNALQS